MAATATQQILNNGARNLVLKYTIAGTTGDATGASLVDVSALDASIGATDLSLHKVQWSITGCSVNLLWDADTDVLILQCSGEGSEDFSSFGGLKSNAGAGATGDVLFTTVGYTASGDGGHIILWFKKS